MTYTDVSDNYLPAEQRSIPQNHRVYTCGMDGETELSFRMPVNAKTLLITNNTDQDLDFYVSLYDGSADTPSGLHSAGTSSRIDTVAAGAEFALAQNTEFNSLHFKAGSAATGLVELRPGDAKANGLADIETKALEAVA